LVLVTGASGFLGGELVKKLVANGESVRIIRRNNSDLAHLKSIIDKIEVKEADILDVSALEDAFENIDQVYHTAAIISFNKQNIAQMYKTNIEGTANVVNVALSSNLKKLIHISSIAAIGGKPNELITEETKWEDNEWTSNYGITKQMAERQIFRGIEEGLEATIINPGIIVGIGHEENKSTLNLLNRISHQKMPFYTNGTNGFVDIDDVVNISIQLMQGNYNKEKFIAISENWSFKQYFESIARALGVPAPKRALNTWTSSIFYNGDALLSFLNPNRKRSFTKENAKIAMEQFSYSNQKVKNALNYNFTPMQETIHKIVKKYQDGNK